MRKGHNLLGSNQYSIEHNIYADKASLVLDWLLRVGIERKSFSLRTTSEECGVSLGLVHRVFDTLILQGIVGVKGIRTAKTYTLKNAALLLENWIEHYSILKNCKMWSYRTALTNKLELVKVLQGSQHSSNVMLALHSAAEVQGYKNTNLKGLEIYLLDPNIQRDIESLLQLEPQEKGYEVLLIRPYYKSLLKRAMTSNELCVSSPLVTFLDLYHFPLRGQEQAEFIAKRAPELKRIFKGSS